MGSGTTESTGERRVVYTEQGPAGTITYSEPGGSLVFHWEYGGGDVLAIIHVGTTAVWQVMHPWAAPHRVPVRRN